MSAPCPLLGFTVRLHLAPGVDDAHAAALRRRFATEVVEALDLSAEGGSSRNADGAWRWTVSRDAGQATEADRTEIGAWAARQPEIAHCEVGALGDLRES